MNVNKTTEKKTYLDDFMNINEDSDLPTIFTMSRVTGISSAIRTWSEETYYGLSVKEISVPVYSDVISPSCPDLKNAEIIICDPGVLGRNYRKMPKLKWAHCTWAGVESLFELVEEKPHFIVTRHYHEDFSELMAEYVMAQVLIFEKNYRSMWAAETEKSWLKMRKCNDIASNRPMKDLTLGILGVGNMGKAIARFFKVHGTKVIGLSRSPRKSSEFGFFDNIGLSLTEVLSSSDYIVNTLPSTPETIGLLDGDVLRTCKKKPVFINVGRGDIVHENNLLNALNNDWLRHAVLDVFTQEPLPLESMLWRSKKVTITPHCAAVSYPKHIAKDFITSFLCYQHKCPLRNVVDWEKGY